MRAIKEFSENEGVGFLPVSIIDLSITLNSSYIKMLDLLAQRFDYRYVQRFGKIRRSSERLQIESQARHRFGDEPSRTFTFEHK